MLAPRSLTRIGTFLALAVLVGCSGGGGSKDLAQVSGKVTMDSAPLDGAKVTFHSTVEVGGAKGTYSTYTDSNGKYSITNVGKDPGIPAGSYKVTVAKADPGKKGAMAPQEGIDAGQIEAAGGKNILGQDYESFATTKLTANLVVGKNENVDFDLKKGKPTDAKVGGTP